MQTLTGPKMTRQPF